MLNGTSEPMRIIHLVLGSILFTGLWSCRRTLPVDQDWLIGLPTYDEVAVAPQFKHDYVVIIHIDQMTCSTCANLHLKNIASWYTRLHNQLGFLTVVHEFDPIYLRNLRRVTGFKNPIVITDGNQLGTGFFVAILDTRRQQLTERLTVDLNASPSLVEFESHLNHLVKSTNP